MSARLQSVRPSEPAAPHEERSITRLRARNHESAELPARAPATRGRCADRLVEILDRAGVDTVYGVPGGAISPIYDALIDCPHIRVVHVRHETAALFMAIGHVRMQPDALPCVLVTSGPGVTNAVTGLAGAGGEGVPVIMIGGEVPRSKFGRQALQEGSADAIDVVSIVRSVTCSAETISIAGRAEFQLDAAIRRARRERRPAFLSLPLDVAMSPLPPRPVLGRPRGAREATSIDARALREATRALAESERPLILVGSGARGAAAGVRALAERLNIPVITSPKAKGIVPETAPYCLGVFGYGGHASALEHLRAHPPDVVLAIGCGFSEPSTNSWSPLLQASSTMIQIDIDPACFGRNYRVDVAMAGDAADLVEALDVALLGQAPRALESKGLTHFDASAMHEDSSPLRPARVLTILQEEMPSDTVYTADIGEHLLFAIHYLRCTNADQFMASLSLGSMGSGICAAIGAKIAAPDRAVVSVCGDYGFQMYGMDLNTCVQEGIGVVFLVMNDARMRMVEAGIQRIYGRGLPMDGPPVDFAAIARAQGAQGFVVRTAEDLRRALSTRDTSRPAVVDVRVDPCAEFPVNARVQEISNFTAK